MPKVKITKIVSCSSESPAHPATNLLLLEPGKNTQWRNADATENTAEVVLQLESPTKITNVNIGNCFSAKIEILVGCSSDGSSFETLLSCQELMNESESRNGVKFNAVRVFLTSDFNAKVAEKDTWDLVKVVCTQNYIKSETFGLAFIAVYTDKPKIRESESDASPVPLQKSPRMIGKFKLRDDSPEGDEPKGLGLLEKWKKGKENEKFVSPSKKVTKPSSDVSDRNRMSLLYDSASSDEENYRVKHSAKKLKKAEEDRKRKSDDETPVKPPKKAKNFSDFLKNEADTPSPSTSKPKNDRKDKEVKGNKTPLTFKTSKDTHDTSKPKKILSESPKPKPRPQTLSPPPARKPKVTRPFKELLNGVTIVISGIQNPERADIRQKALDMGARYSQNWHDNGCTHLICAFKNTPKFREVQGKGKIITKDWITNGHRLRKRLPWRRYALDDADRVPDESEEEVFEEVVDEKDVLDMYDLDYDIPEKKTDDVYNRSTDDDNSRDAPVRPKLFHGKSFYIHANVEEDKSIVKHLEQVILEQEGKLIKDLHDADFVLTVEKLKGEDLGVKGEILDPKWVFECVEMEGLVPTRGFLMKFES